jgi:hypothetical protein
MHIGVPTNKVGSLCVAIAMPHMSLPHAALDLACNSTADTCCLTHSHSIALAPSLVQRAAAQVAGLLIGSNSGSIV